MTRKNKPGSIPPVRLAADDLWNSLLQHSREEEEISAIILKRSWGKTRQEEEAFTRRMQAFETLEQKLAYYRRRLPKDLREQLAVALSAKNVGMISDLYQEFLEWYDDLP